MIAECPYDGNQVTVYVKYHSNIKILKHLRADDVVLFKNAYRKVSGGVDLVCQILLRDKNDRSVQVIGSIDRHNYEFPESVIDTWSLVDIPNSAIVRNKICLNVTIVDINYVKVMYICEQCRKPIDESNRCGSD